MFTQKISRRCACYLSCESRQSCIVVWGFCQWGIHLIRGKSVCLRPIILINHPLPFHSNQFSSGQLLPQNTPSINFFHKCSHIIFSSLLLSNKRGLSWPAWSWWGPRRLRQSVPFEIISGGSWLRASASFSAVSFSTVIRKLICSSSLVPHRLCGYSSLLKALLNVKSNRETWQIYIGSYCKLLLKKLFRTGVIRTKCCPPQTLTVMLRQYG